MKTFALRGGDLVLRGDNFVMVEGAARVQQHLGLALREPFGSDRFAPRWGSTLPLMIGSVIGRASLDDIQSEVMRVIRNHLVIQKDQLRSRSMQGQKPTLLASEIITEISGVKVSQNGDSVIVKVGLGTAGAQQITVLTAATGGP